MFKKWWQHVHPECRYPRPPNSKIKPEFSIGDSVCIRKNNNRIRKINKVEWHWHRYEYVYIIDTDAPTNFEPYWFASQLQRA